MSVPDDAPPPGDARRMRLLGLHHVTLISSDLQRTTGFWRDVLGFGVVRAGTNDDDPGARHFWFGDGDGTAGTLISFLEYPQMARGRSGVGLVHHVALSVGSGEELLAWRDYLRSTGVACSEIFDRGPFRSIYFRDPDEHLIEIATL